MRVTILDGYIDEPSRLGVPPFISPYVRYAYGAAADAGCEPEYITIDGWRQGRRPTGDMALVISGPVVPGRYLRSMPMSSGEMAGILEYLADAGIDHAVWHSADPTGGAGRNAGAVHVRSCDPDAFLYDALSTGRPERRRRTLEEWARWSVLGAECVKGHQDHPQPLIAEMDMSYGCPGYIDGGCSFCTEPLFGEPVFRPPGDVVAEVRALLKHGCTNFRLGGQSCILSYMARGVGEVPRPRPDPEALAAVLKPLARLEGIRVLHTDNAEPGVMAAHPEESRRILDLLVRACTPGNVLSLGMESADPAVAEANNLNSGPGEVLAAVRMINRAGAGRGSNGMPLLLPGINILAGLDGETPNTFRLNLDFLKGMLDAGLMLRRINIRQVSPVRRRFGGGAGRRYFIRFKKEVRETVDRPMLERVVPRGTVLRDVYAELRIGNLMFGRQVGTYPVLVGMPPGPVPGTFLDVKVTDHGSRSLTAVEYPLDVNTCPISALEALPGIGRKRAMRLFNARPLQGPDDLRKALDDASLADCITEYLAFGASGPHPRPRGEPTGP